MYGQQQKGELGCLLWCFPESKNLDNTSAHTQNMFRFIESSLIFEYAKMDWPFFFFFANKLQQYL